MWVESKVVVLTGAAGGIGAALARRFTADGASGLVLADLDPEPLHALAAELGQAALPRPTDVADPEAVAGLVTDAEAAFGRIDLFCSNAGLAFGSGIDTADEDWARAWSVNVMAHVYAARAVLPGMLRRGSGYLLNTASAAGLLTMVGDAPYSVSKHAAVGLAEWLSVTYGDAGIGVSVLAPMGVRTGMLLPQIEQGDTAALAVAASGELLSPEQVAEAVVAGLDEERLLILPHPEVGRMYAKRAADPDRWVAGMRRTYG
jgi:NAD(P)-dependent dehydrogenase (short-subunit alcohol dehydrogenase family)